MTSIAADIDTLIYRTSLRELRQMRKLCAFDGERYAILTRAIRERRALCGFTN